MRLLPFTVLLLWASLARAADPSAPAASAGAPVAQPAAVGTPLPPPVPQAAPAAARDPEGELARELAAKTTEGRAVELTVGDRKVQALYLPRPGGRAMGAVVLLHDLGGHADWPGVVAPLRRALPAHGWSTLSVQLPLPAKGAPATGPGPWLDQATPRIDAALEFLKGEDQGPVVLAGHGLGAAAALDYAAAHPERLRGAVLISLPHRRGDDPRLGSGALGRVTLPLMEIYGTADTGEIAATAPERRAAAAGRGNYLQVGLPGAGHFFQAQEATLAARLRGWLRRHAAEPPPADAAPNTNDTKGTSP